MESKREEYEKILKEYINIRNPAIWNGLVIILLGISAFTVFWQNIEIGGTPLVFLGLILLATIAVIQIWVFYPLVKKYHRSVKEKLGGGK